MHSGIEIWRIENFRPVSVSKSSHGKFFTGDSYVILKVGSLIRFTYIFSLFLYSYITMNISVI